MDHSPSPLNQIRGPVATEEVYRPAVAPRTGRISQYDILSWVIQAPLSLLGLILLSPVFLLIALLIKITDRGPVFYQGKRVGRGKRIFKIYKFRTLRQGTEETIGARLLTYKERYTYCTKIGRLLKRSKLDELPQLLNVIRGEMRLAGPRPIRPVFLAQFEREVPYYASRFLGPPGITGIAQLRGGYYTSPRNKHRYDLIYIKNRSLLLDLKIIFMTFVKILDRWLSRGFFVLFLFLFVSFTPPSLQPLLYLSFFGIKVSLVHLFIIGVAGWIFLKRGPSQFSLYRCPLNLPILLFIFLSVLFGFFSQDPYRALQGSGYYLVTGFLVSFLIVNSLATSNFITFTARAIALTSVLLSLFGIFQIFMLNYISSYSGLTERLLEYYTLALSSSSGLTERLLADYTRASSVPGNPKVLAVYLVLGIPLLLSEMVRASSQRGRDFWLVCVTISFVGIFFTQSRLGLLSLLVTGTVFLYRRWSHALYFFTIFLLCILFLVSLGVPRFSLPGIREDMAKWVEERTRIASTVPVKNWLIGGGVMMTPEQAGEPDHQKSNKPERNKWAVIRNMHVTLMLEQGIAGWLIMMWLILSSLWAMKQAHDRTKDERLKITLWAIISSVVGFLVSMNGMNTFHNLTIQIFFWSLIGIGLGIVIQLNGHLRQNLIWRLGDSGD